MSTWAVLVPMSIGIAISPVPLIELILVLFSKRRLVNSIAFIVALLVFTAAAVAIGAAGTDAADGGSSDPSVIVSVVFAALGLLLLAIGVKNWRNRADTSEPPILATISSLGPAAVAFLAFGAVFVNPKNLPLLLGAGSTIAATSSPLWFGIGFVLLTTLPYSVAAGYSIFGGPSAAARLDRMRAWLIARNRLIMGIICVLLGLVLLAKGVAGLL
jgi:Sap, sulfolipid-1-addressing protein